MISTRALVCAAVLLVFACILAAEGSAVRSRSRAPIARSAAAAAAAAASHAHTTHAALGEHDADYDTRGETTLAPSLMRALAARGPRSAPQRQGRRMAQMAAAAAGSSEPEYSYFMAYHPEPIRPPLPLYEAQYDLEEFHANGGYDSEMNGTVSNARLFAAAMKPGNNSAWVFDVDETSLSGYAEMLSIGFGYVAKLNHEWIMAADAPAIPQTLGLYRQLIESGFRVIFLTGRKDYEHDATVDNLHSAGYTTFDTLITRTPAEYNLTAAAYKSARRTQLVQQDGYDIVGCVGDQWSDISGPYTGFKVKLPNYIYWLN